MQLPVVVFWTELGKKRAEGATRNISLGGILLTTENCPEEGRRVTIEVTFPAPQKPSGKIQLRCVGRVIRHLIEYEECKGFAVSGAFGDELSAAIL